MTDTVTSFHDWLLDNGASKSTAYQYTTRADRLPTDFTNHIGNYGTIRSMLEPATTTAMDKAAYKKYCDYLKTLTESIDEQQSLEWIKTEVIPDITTKQAGVLSKNDVLKKYLSVEKVRRLYHAVQNHYTNPGQLLGSDRMLYEFRLLPLFLFETGVRIQKVTGRQGIDEDVRKLTKDDVDLDDETIHIRGSKNNSYRTVNISESTQTIKKFMQRFVPDASLFTLPYWKVRYEFAKLGHRLFGLGKPRETGSVRLTPHWFRHSFATNYVLAAKKEHGSWAQAKEDVRRYLGHTDIATTEAYIGAAQELDRDNLLEQIDTFNITE